MYTAIFTVKAETAELYSNLFSMHVHYVCFFHKVNPIYIRIPQGLANRLDIFHSLPPTAIPTAGAGVVASGLIIYFFKIKGRRVPFMGLVLSILVSVTLLAFLIHCPTSDLAGVIVPYADG